LFRSEAEAAGRRCGLRHGQVPGLGLVKDKRIAPHIPLWDRSKREDGTFSTSDFKWDRRRGVYICPNGKAAQDHRNPCT